MSYVSRHGRRPNEYASKSSHGYIVNDEYVKDFLGKCTLPETADENDINKCEQFDLGVLENNPIKHVIAIDGGYTQAEVKKEYPSSNIGFLQFGPLYFKIEDLHDISKKPFIDPKDIAKLKQIERHKLAIPLKNIIFKDEETFTDSVRRKIYDFFANEKEQFIETLEWLIFEGYNSGTNNWVLSRCPKCEERKLVLEKNKMSKDYMFNCPNCHGLIYLTDVFRLHEAIDDELGAGGIMGYLITTLEQMVMIHWIKSIISISPKLLNEMLFIKDGPLAFFGQTANIHQPMRKLVQYLFEKHNLFMAGLEKSGPFVEHAHEISNNLKPGTVMLLNNEYIYKFIMPSKTNLSDPYGSTTYYGNKVIFKTNEGGVYVVTLPTVKNYTNPQKDDFRNIEVVLSNIAKLKCDMYDNSLFPIALANKLVSLSHHPSSQILEKFAQNEINGN